MSFSRRIGNPVAVDQQPGALIGIGDHAGADDDSLVRLSSTFKAMPVLRFTLCARCRSPTRIASFPDDG
jgi:hypothetical protein